MIWLLLILFTVKHFLADFPLQPPSMAHDKTLPTPQWILALVCHAAVHGFLTALVCWTVGLRFWWIGLLDFALHGTIDRIKANNSHRWTPEDRYFWWLLGADQAAHTLCYVGYIAILVHKW